MKAIAILIAVLIATPALAQQQVTASQLAVEVINNISAMARAMEQQAQLIKAQQDRINELEKQLAEKNK